MSPDSEPTVSNVASSLPGERSVRALVRNGENFPEKKFLGFGPFGLEFRPLGGLKEPDLSPDDSRICVHCAEHNKSFFIIIELVSCSVLKIMIHNFIEIEQAPTG